jgi:hypothetical protein
MNACGKPLFFDRLLRVPAGLACFPAIPFVPVFEHAWLRILALALAGLTFVVAGIRAKPGCEITALPNLVLPAHRQLSCWCATLYRDR